MGQLSVRVSGCVSDSIVDGPGMRFVVFVQGCPHHCAGCHNPQTHDFAAGEVVDAQKIVDAVLQNPLAKGVTFSGGEPFCQPEPLCWIGHRLVEQSRDVVVYSGYTLEELVAQGKERPAVLELLGLADWLIDGRYEQTLRDLTLPFRGSSNQRVLSRDEIRAALTQ